MTSKQEQFSGTQAVRDAHRFDEARQELRRLDREKARELSSIQLLRAEVAYLESPERLAAIEKGIELPPDAATGFWNLELRADPAAKLASSGRGGES